jgi:hypothetical protein
MFDNNIFICLFENISNTERVGLPYKDKMIDINGRLDIIRLFWLEGDKEEKKEKFRFLIDRWQYFQVLD